MSEHDSMHDEGMPADMAALLDQARVLDVPEGAQERVRARLDLALPPPVPPTSGGAPPAQPATLASRGLPLWAAPALLALGGTLGFMVATNTATRERIVERPGPTVTVTVTVPAPALQPMAPSLSPEALPSALSPMPSAGASAAQGPHHGPDLAKERAMLDVARTALGRSDGASALTAARAHQAAFPRGALREESDAIEFQALMLLHDGKAQSRGRQFLAKYPKSLYGPAIEAALRTTTE